MSGQDSPSRFMDQYPLRFPDGMRAKLKDAAAQNNRSMNSEIISRIEASFQAGSSSLDGEIAALISRHVDAEVQRRLRAIASQIGGAA